MPEHIDLLEDPDGAPYPEEVQVMWEHISDLAVTTTREPTRETVVAALESVFNHQRTEIGTLSEKWLNEADSGEDERYGRIIARTLRSCAGELHEALGGCCGSCEGTGFQYGGDPCWDCRGTGHPHPSVSETREGS